MLTLLIFTQEFLLKRTKLATSTEFKKKTYLNQNAQKHLQQCQNIQVCTDIVSKLLLSITSKVYTEIDLCVFLIVLPAMISFDPLNSFGEKVSRLEKSNAQRGCLFLFSDVEKSVRLILGGVTSPGLQDVVDAYTHAVTSRWMERLSLYYHQLFYHSLTHSYGV